METVYLVGQFVTQCNNKRTWEPRGIYDSKTLAEQACKEVIEFVVPITLNKKIDINPKAPGLYFPDDIGKINYMRGE